MRFMIVPSLADSHVCHDLDLKRHGLVLLMRHARTEPGIGDPPGFSLGNCGTQRNLDAEGRAQARRVGERLATMEAEMRNVSTVVQRIDERTQRLAGKGDR